MGSSLTTGTLLIHSVPTVVLFDSGSTHTFISGMIVGGIGVLVDDLGYDLVVSPPARSVLATGECVKGIAIIIQRCVLS